MKRARLFSLALLATAAIASPAAAQRTAESFLYDDEHDHALRFTAAMDPALAFGVGYLHAVPIEIDRFHRRLGVHIDVTALVDFSSWDFTGGVSMFLAEGAGFNALATIDLELKIVQNAVHDGLAYGYRAALRPGWYDPVWYASLELALHGTIATTVFHRDAYRAMVPQAADGTYVTDHLTFFLGGAIGFRIERVVLVGLRFAWRFPRTLETYAPYLQPYTINVEIGTRF